METNRAETEESVVFLKRRVVYGFALDSFNSERRASHKPVTNIDDLVLDSALLLTKNPSDNMQKFAVANKKIKTVKASHKINKGLVICRKNPYLKSFNQLINWLYLYSVISSLYYLGFQKPGFSQFVFDMIVWAIFILNFFLTFFVEVRTSRGNSIKNLKLIARRYMKTWMIFDIAALLPLQFGGNPNAEYLLRLFRILKLNKLVESIDRTKINNWVLGLLKIKKNKKSRIFGIILAHLWDIFYQILIMLFFSYALACVWFYYVDLIISNQDETTNFIDRFALNNESPGNRLIKGWYYIYTTLLTVGYGDFFATNKYEMGLCIFVLTFGVTSFAIIMGETIETIKQLSDVNKESDFFNDFEVWLSTLEAHYRRLPISLKEKIIRHFKHYFYNDKAGHFAQKHWECEEKSEINTYHNKFLSEIPENLRFKILNQLFGEIFYKFRLFFGSQDNFRYIACLYIQPRFYSVGSVLISFNQVPLEILFVEKGKIICTTDNCTEGYTYKSRSTIGDYLVINKLPSFANYVAVKNIEGFGLNGKVIRYLLKHYPIQAALLKRFSDKAMSLVKHSLGVSKPETPKTRTQPSFKSSIGRNSGLKKSRPVSKQSQTNGIAIKKQANLIAELKDRLIEYAENVCPHNL